MHKWSRSSFSHQRGKFTRGNPQEFQHQISSHSRTAQIRLASSSSRENDGKKRVKCNVVLYDGALLLLNVCYLVIIYFFGFCFTRLFSYYENEDRVLGLRFSFSLVFVFVTSAAPHDVHTKYFRNLRKLVSDIPIFSWNDEYSYPFRTG